jgi:DNA invertase Pin-like site-specific DNA recombinase
MSSQGTSKLPIASKASDLPVAVGYLRKSTKGERLDRHGKKQERQEKSIPQQKAEVIKLAAGRFNVVKWFEDEGISGWKREAKRPDFQRMLAEVNRLGAVAILCDNIDRFSRASYDDVQEDSSALRKAGVRWIVTCSHGEYDLHAGRRNDIGGIITFAAAVWAAHEYSRQLSRRISLARRNKATEGKRSGGYAAYGLELDGGGGLKHGDAKKGAVVQRLFAAYGNQRKSLNQLAEMLNAEKLPSPTGGRWRVRTIALLLRRRAYRGDFAYGVNPQGQFYGLDGQGEVREKEAITEPGKVFRVEGAYKPLVDPVLFDKVQRRLDARANERKGRKDMGYALTGVLICDHCGGSMYGVRKRGHTVVYRCSDTVIHGKGGCPQHQVREDRILPYLVTLLGEEIADLEAKLAAPVPEHIKNPRKGEAERLQQLQTDRDRLAKKIANAMTARIESDDKRTRQEYDTLITGWRDELERLDSELATAEALKPGELSSEETKALAAWWQKFESTAVPIPNTDNLFDPIADPRAVNEMLRQVGCEVRLRWETEEYQTSGGILRRRHVLTRGRFRLGQRDGNLPRHLLEPSAA